MSHGGMREWAKWNEEAKEVSVMRMLRRGTTAITGGEQRSCGDSRLLIDDELWRSCKDKEGSSG